MTFSPSRGPWLGVIGVVLVSAIGVVGAAQKTTAADTAAALSGVWVLNHGLSPDVKPAAAGGAAGGRRGQIVGSDLALLVMPAQGRGGRGGGGDAGGAAAAVNPAQAAASRFMASLRQVPERITIQATADSVTFVDPRGTRTFPVTGKDAPLEIEGATVTNNSKWDKDSLKQKVVSGDTADEIDWTLDKAHTRLNYKITTSNLATDNSHFTEVKAVFDKQP